MNEILNRASGALNGAIIGDALGGRYEFMNNYLKQIEIDMISLDFKGSEIEFLPMLGGGIWKLIPGQITDDSELSLTLAQSIIESKSIDQDRIAHNYHQWFRSGPFDIGNATKNALVNPFKEQMILASIDMDKQSLKIYGDVNLSNGMMMRISPLGIYIAGYLHRLDSLQKAVSENIFNKIINTIKIDTELTHSSKKALDFAVSYVILMAYSILDGSMDRGRNILKKYLPTSEAVNIMMNGIDMNSKLAHDPKEKIGDVRIAFQLAVRKGYFAQHGQMRFDEAVISTVKLGGDTDTNACIVGGLVGSIVGINSIPNQWVQNIKSNQLINCSRYEKYQINKIVSNLDAVSKQIFMIGYENLL
jgi:ADP-ribosyl-[dinitrogen reductase] hydrolase